MEVQDRLTQIQTENIEFGMIWTNEKQTFYCGEEKFTNDGAITTAPSHDLAHLLIAGSGNLSWKPDGEDSLLRIAEYNAVFLEHLCVHSYECVESRTIEPHKIIPTIKEFMKWFVDTHYAPFPVNADEAYYQFCSKINAPVIIRLCPVMYHQIKKERTGQNLTEYDISFRFNDTPHLEGNVFLFQELMSKLLSNLKIEVSMKALNRLIC